MKEKALLIMAAGMGSRFGGLKQIEPIGPNGEFLIDYSIYDALKFGFNKVVFVIKEENYELFKSTIGNRISNRVKVEYAFQKADDIPEDYNKYLARVKPWGTGQAILCAKDKIHGSFGVINADDFYGRDGFKVLAEFLDNHQENNWLTVGYHAINTLSEFGPAKRGVCQVNNNVLESIIESKLEKINGVIMAEPLSGEQSFSISNDTLVSMNMFGFYDSIFPILESEFKDFFTNIKDINKEEFLIPDVLQKCINNKVCNMFILPTSAKWLGMTYKEDEELVIKEINKLIASGEYPKDIWN